MNKSFFMLTLTFFPFLNCFSQTNLSESNFIIEKSISLPTLCGEGLYQNARQWTLKTLKPGDELVYMDEENQKQLVYTGSILLKDRNAACAYVNASAKYKLTIQVKDELYTYTISQILHDYIINCGEYGVVPAMTPMADLKVKDRMKSKIYAELNEKFDLLIKDLEASMADMNQAKE